MNKWKQMRLSIVFSVALCVTLMLTACGSGNKNAPDKATLEEDLSSSLADYKGFLSLGSYEIERSMTEDSNYTATIDIVAEAASGCAEYRLTADVSYTKYDQGWSLDDCELTEEGYEIIEFPSEVEVPDWDSLAGEGTKIMTKSISVEVYDEEDGVVVHKEPYEDIQEQYEEYGNTFSYWNYRNDSDTWENCDNMSIGPSSECIKFELTQSIAGTWRTYTPTDSTAIISNVTNTSFDLYLPYYQASYHLEQDPDKLSRFIGTDSNSYEFSAWFDSGTLEPHAMMTKLEYDGIMLKFQCLAPDSIHHEDQQAAVIPFLRAE